ncbi:NAD(P)-dependent oxidoreductase [Streptomyces sp. NPDC048269]|uniref:NAD-dependent epimerase/dehydratase family protein n=1 Tax=Streptomyces sp. NPDC048269 TaxID=3155753 RepID=UPI00341F47AE
MSRIPAEPPAPSALPGASQRTGTSSRLPVPALRVVVTGATGFVGRRLCARLMAAGNTVTALVRRSSRTEHLTAHRILHADLTTGEGLRAAALGSDCVIHLAAVVKARTARGYQQCNTDGTRRLAEALLDLPTPPRLVLCSSLAAAGPSLDGRPRTEDQLPAPVSHYGRSKLGGENAARNHAERLQVVILRPPIVYGPGDPAFLPALLPMIRSGFVIKGGLGPKRYSLLHVDDLCDALTSACHRGTTVRQDDLVSGIYTVSDGVEHTWHQLCATVAAALGRRPPLVLPLPATAAYPVACAAEAAGLLSGFVPALNRDKVKELRQTAWTCSTERARLELGFTAAVPLAEGIAHYLTTL